MAHFNFVGIDDLIAQFDKMADGFGERAFRAVTAGGEALKAEFEKTVAVRTGQLKAAMFVSRPIYDYAKGWYVQVYPKGTAKNGRKRKRLEEVAFVLEYGRENMPAQPWMRPAMETGAEAVKAAMREAFLKE